ncbi:hypothetical protein [Vibrio navarrensis]|uniref:hypothetical protein n=1 Tax=Vibrio navarrensis TaxID=29495 RepID=UPI001D047202|nr:hypothetical protein [Vibrio navarrensis]
MVIGTDDLLYRFDVVDLLESENIGLGLLKIECHFCHILCLALAFNYLLAWHAAKPLHIPSGNVH